MSRLEEWDEFSALVREHIEEYVLPQWGDAPNDPVSGWTAEKCMQEVQKYAHRFGRSVRGAEEELRDLLKIAHYAAMIHSKRREQEDGDASRVVVDDTRP